VQDEYVLDTETVRAFVGDVRAAMARTDSAAAMCDAIRPRFAESLADDAWLRSELRAPAPESGMGGAIGQWLLYCADRRSRFGLGLYRGAQDEVFAPRNGSLELVAPRAVAAGDLYALIPPQDDIHRVRRT
jgi:hypothetical protein